MKPEQLVPGGAARVALGGHAGHSHAATEFLSRRRFVQTAVGATALGAVAGAGLLRTTGAYAASPGIGLMLPIPTTAEFFPGVRSHVQAPPFLVGPDSDPSTVYNFQGAAGVAFISGTCERHNRKTGETRTLPYLFNDMRFMKGVVRGRDGHARRATLGFI